MANKYSLDEATPANTDDALEGPLRIREIKQSYNERIGRDHLIGGVTSPDVIAQGADSSDSGYHRRLTIREETSDQATNANNRLNASSTGINDSTTAKMAEVWVEKSSATGNTTSIRFIGTEGAGNQRTVVTTDQTQTLTNKTLDGNTFTTVDINSGAIDNTTVGANNPSTGKFTTLEATGAVTLGDANADTIGLKGTISGVTETYIGANQNFSGLVGEIRMYAGASAPAGWLLCDGSSITDTQLDGKYQDLIDVIAGGSASSATLPDLRGTAPIGAGTGTDLTNRPLHEKSGNETHTLTSAESGVRHHTHTITTEVADHDHPLPRFTAWGDGNYGTSFENGGDAADTTTGTKEDLTATSTVTATDESSGSAHNNMQPYYAINFIIKY